MTDTLAGAGSPAPAPASRTEVRDGMRIEFDVPIPMDDGIVLRADVFRPVDDAPVPVILSYGPYAKGLAFQEGYADQWNIMARQHPDVTRETRDLYDCIEWAGTLEWSTGRVGLAGISYYAINQWTVAALQPPHLAAICPWEGAADFYRDMTHHGGILSTFFPNWFDKQVLVVQHGLGERGAVSPVTGEPVAGPETLSDEELAANRSAFGADIRAHALDDDYHRERSPDFARITVPLLSAGNWGGQGLHPRGNFEGYLRSASEQKWLEVHGLEHWTEFYTDYGADLQKRFFACFLQGDDSGWRDQPPVQLQVRGVDGFVQRAEREWPLARTQWTRMHLDLDAHALRDEPAGAETSASFDATGDGVTFRSEPLETETELTGPLAAKLWLSSSTADADVFAVLRAFTPDGSELVY